MIALAFDLIGVGFQDPDHPVDLGSVKIGSSAAICDPVDYSLLTLRPIRILRESNNSHLYSYITFRTVMGEY